MLERPTTFVIGAGAGVGIKMPTGNDLRSKISQALRFEYDFGQLKHGEWVLERAIRDRAGDALNEYFKAARYISDEIILARSIDDFIDANRDDAAVNFCGKLAIAWCLLQCERKSHLYFDQNSGEKCFDVNRLESSWFMELFRIIQVPYSDLESIFKNATFVSFNYDRTLEHFFYHTIKRFYRLSDADASRVMNGMDVFHPYGTIGQIPQYKPAPDKVITTFGGGVGPAELNGIVGGLRTYTETIDDSDDLSSIKRKIADTGKLVFLGFAFHRQNMNLLQPGVPLQASRVYATAPEWPPTEREIAERQIGKFCGEAFAEIREVHLYDATCDKLIKDYARAIQYA